MLTPALRVGEPDPQAPMDRTCVSTGRSPETSGPRRLMQPTPTLATRREATPRRNGVSFVHGYSGPAGGHAMVVAHFFESGQRRVYVGAESRAHRYAGAVALAARVIAAIDEKAWAGPRRLGPGVQVSHSVSRIAHGDSSRAEYARRKVESSFWSGGWIAAQLRPRGQAVVGERYPEELRRHGSSCVLSIAFTARFYYDLTETSAKNLWGATHRT